MAAFKISSARPKAAQKFWAPQQCNKKWVAPERETAPIRLLKEMGPPEAMKTGRLSNRALAAAGGKCRCGPLGRESF